MPNKKKPKVPGINFSHPLANSLQYDFLLDEGGGRTIRDLVTGAKMTSSGTGVTWANKYGDSGVDFDASGEYFRNSSAPAKYKLPSSGRFSVEIEFSRDSGGSGTAYGTIAGTGQGTAFGDRVWLLENDNGNSGWGQVFQVWWGSQPGIWSIPYPASGIKHHLVVIYDGSSTSNNPTMYLNGVKQTVTRRLDPSGSLRTAITAVAIGNNAEAGGTWDGNVYRLRQWSRLLTDREARELYKNPYQIYRQSSVIGKATGAAPPTTVTTTHTTDTLLKKQFTLSHTTDALFKKALTVGHTANALLKKTFTLSHTTGSLLKKSAEISHFTDSFIKKSFEKTHTTNALLKKTLTTSHSTDSFLTSAACVLDVNNKPTITNRYITANGSVYKRAQKFIASQNGKVCRIVLKVGVFGTPTDDIKCSIWTHDSGSNIPSVLIAYADSTIPSSELTDPSSNKSFIFQNSIVSISSGVSYWIVLERTGTQDAANYFVWDGSNSAAYQTIRVFNNTDWTTLATGAVGLWFEQYTDTSANPTEVTVTHTSDALLKATSTKSHTTDSALKKALTVSHTSDSLLKKEFTKTHTTNALLKKAATKIHTTNSLLKKTQTVTHTANSLLKKTQSLVHTTSALIKKVFTLSYTSDALLKKLDQKSHTTDSYIIRSVTTSHTTDALIATVIHYKKSVTVLSKKKQNTIKIKANKKEKKLVFKNIQKRKTKIYF